MLNRRELLTGAGVAALAAGLPDDLKALTPQQRSTLLGGANLPPWVQPGAVIDEDFFNARSWPRAFAIEMADTRSSAQLVPNSSGLWTSVSALALPISTSYMEVEGSGTNNVRNSAAQGAIAMADGVQLLTNANFASGNAGWTVNPGSGSISFTGGQLLITGDGTTTNTYIAQQVTGLIVGRNYAVTFGGQFGLNVKVGTSANDPSVLNINLQGDGSGSPSPSKSAFTATATSLWVTYARQTASQATITSASVSDGERVQNGTFSFNPISASQNTVQNGWQWRLTPANGTAAVSWNSGAGTVSLTGDGTNSAQITQAIPTVPGFTYTIAVDVTGSTNVSITASTGSFNSGTNLLSVTPNPGTAQKFQFTATGSTTWIGFGKTGAATPTIGNILVQSAGALPTNWAIGQLGTLLFNVAAVGAESGFSAVDIEYFGSSTGTTILQYFEANTQIAATAGQVVAPSVFAKVTAGTQTNISSFAMGVRINSSGGANLGILAATGGNSTPGNSSAALGASRAYGSVTLTNGTGTTAFVVPEFAINVASGAIDITVRYAQPKLEFGSKATSPITTTGTSATRAANAITLQRTGIGRLVLTFDDDSQQTISGIDTASQYTLVPANLNRPLIKRMTGYAA